MKKSDTLKFDGLGVVWNMKGQLLVISKTSFVLVVDKLFPRSNDGLGRCMFDVCFCVTFGGARVEILCFPTPVSVSLISPFS